jgi:glycosyltransferase involved in cell wall biosynthesis
VRLRSEFDIPEAAFVLSVVARFEPAKGHEQLLAGLKVLQDLPGPPVVVLLAGTGEGEKRVRAEVERLGLEHAVRFTGYRNDIPDLLVASDAAVLTSLYEGIPRALMESMGAGLPVVATDVPGTRSLVVDGQTGFLVPLGDVAALADALQALRTDPELAEMLGRAGRQRIETEFDERIITDRIVAVYEHIRGRTGGPLPSWDPSQTQEIADDAE